MSDPIVFVPHSWGLSHVGRSLLVARALQRRGYRCVFVGDGPFVLPENSMVRRAGIEVVPLVDMAMHKVLVNGFGFHSRESLRTLVNAEREMIAELRPRLIVSDYRPSVHVSAAIEKIPVVTLINACYTHFWGDPITPPIEHPVTLKAKRFLGEKLGMAVLRQFAPRIARKIFRQDVGIYNELLAEHGLPTHEDILRLFEGSLATYLTDAPEWVRIKPKLPASVHVPGPLYWAPDAPEDWDADLPTDKPWIYLSAGSTANPDVFPALFRELGGLPYRFLMSTAGLDLPEGLPENLTVRNFLPAEQVMRRSVLSIVNGGPSVYQTVKAQVPLLVVAMRGDQEWNGKDAKRFGVGKLLYRRHVIDEPGLLRRTVTDMVENAERYRPGLRAMAEKLESYRAVETVADGVAAAYEARGPVGVA